MCALAPKLGQKPPSAAALAPVPVEVPAAPVKERTDPELASGKGIANPAADMRNMRRVIAEDPEWSLSTVPLLSEICLKHIVDNFECMKLM